MTPFERAAAVVVAEIGPSMSPDGRLMRRRWRQRCLDRLRHDPEAFHLIDRFGPQALFIDRRMLGDGSVVAAVRRLRRRQ